MMFMYVRMSSDDDYKYNFVLANTPIKRKCQGGENTRL